jgi:hypothetical protein
MTTTNKDELFMTPATDRKAFNQKYMQFKTLSKEDAKKIEASIPYEQNPIFVNQTVPVFLKTIQDQLKINKFLYHSEQFSPELSTEEVLKQRRT